ncbi:MAG: hypothetical protein IJ220_04200 [Clostridia bacterium]|nr:hypothetical protein [Clostridia bacterium]
MKRKTNNENILEKNKKNNNKKNKKLSKIKFWILKHIQYDEIIIYEKIGVLDPLITAITIPFVSTITTFPLNFLNVNYQNFKYEIFPDYNHLVFVLDLKAKASFRIVDFIISIIQEKLHKLNNRI